MSFVPKNTACPQDACGVALRATSNPALDSCCCSVCCGLGGGGSSSRPLGSHGFTCLRLVNDAAVAAPLQKLFHN